MPLYPTLESPPTWRRTRLEPKSCKWVWRCAKQWKTVQLQGPADGKGSRNHRAAWGTVWYPEHSAAFKCLRESQRTCGNKIAVTFQEDMSHWRWSAIKQQCSSSLPSPWLDETGIGRVHRVPGTFLIKDKENCFRPSCVLVYWRTVNKMFWMTEIYFSHLQVPTDSDSDGGAFPVLSSGEGDTVVFWASFIRVQITFMQTPTLRVDYFLTLLLGGKSSVCESGYNITLLTFISVTKCWAEVT